MIEFKSSHRFALVPARKIRSVIDLVRGLPVNEALDLLRTSKRRAATFIDKVLRSAVANASQDPEVNLNKLVVLRAWADSGPLHQGRLRWRPGPMGRAMPIRKRTSHIHVVVADLARSRRGDSVGEAPAAEAPASEKSEKKSAAGKGDSKPSRGQKS